MRYESKTKSDPLGNIKYGSLESEEFYPFLWQDISQDPFVVELAGITYPDKNYFIERKHSDYHVLEYIVNGKGFLVNNGLSYSLQAGDVVMLEIGTSHRYGADKSHPYTKKWINFFSDIFCQLRKSYGMEDKTVVHCPQSAVYFEEFMRIAETQRFNDEIAIEISLIIFKILAELAQTLRRQEHKSALAKEAKIILDASIHDQVSIDALAKSLHISKMHLITEFKKNYGETPYEYISNRKIEMSKKLLKFTTLRIKEIAQSLKFNDSHHFSNAFKKKTGISPLEYRKS